MNDMMKIVMINAYIQRERGKIYLDGKEVLCVSLDHTCALVGEGDGKRPLTYSEIDALTDQCFKNKRQSANQQ